MKPSAEHDQTPVCVQHVVCLPVVVIAVSWSSIVGRAKAIIGKRLSSSQTGRTTRRFFF
jgi:hypothetical protein